MRPLPKILIDLERLRYPNSGIANVFRNLAQGLQEINTELELSYFGTTKELSNISIPPLLKIKKWRKWHKFYENFSPSYQLIHTSHQLSSYFHRNYKAAIKVVTLHDLNFLHENLSEQKKQKMLKKVNRNLKYADYIVCISQFVKDDVLKHQHLLELKKLKEIIVIHNGIALPEQKQYSFGRFSFLQEKEFMLNIGVLFEKKNQKTIIEMLPHLDEDLVLVASDKKEPYADEIKSRIKTLGLEHRVHFLSNITEEEKYALLQHCKSYIHPSIAEGFGIPPIEAMAFGKPVFLSQYTSLPEIGGNVAYYFQDFQPENMLRTYTNGMKDYSSNIKENQDKIKTWASQFSYLTMAQAYYNFYRKILTPF